MIMASNLCSKTFSFSLKVLALKQITNPQTTSYVPFINQSMKIKINVDTAFLLVQECHRFEESRFHDSQLEPSHGCSYMQDINSNNERKSTLSQIQIRCKVSMFIYVRDMKARTRILCNVTWSKATTLSRMKKMISFLTVFMLAYFINSI